MTLSERIAAHNAKYPVCVACGASHNGAAWTPGIGWHDHSAGVGRALDALIPVKPTVSPWVEIALSGRLPAKEYGR